VPIRLKALRLTSMVPSCLNEITERIFVTELVHTFASRTRGQVTRTKRIRFDQFAFHDDRRALMGSDALAPAFVHNVLDPLEISSAQRSDVAVRVIDDFGEMRQLDLLGLRKEIVIKVLKQRIARTRRFRESWQQAA
jgi:hypothetical protein